MLKSALALKKELILIKDLTYFGTMKKNLTLRIFLSILREILINTDLKEKRNYIKS